MSANHYFKTLLEVLFIYFYQQDLSSLLKTISEALASTITLPASGSKKLRLRLSVGSEDSGDPKSFGCDANSSDNKENLSKETMPSHPSVKFNDTQGVAPPPTGYPQHSQVRREAGGRTHRRQGRSMSASQADCNGLDGRNIGKRRHGVR